MWAITGMSGGLWWILLGLFVVTMASGEEQLARTSAAVAGLHVRDVMTPDPGGAEAPILRSVHVWFRMRGVGRRTTLMP